MVPNLWLLLLRVGIHAAAVAHAPAGNALAGIVLVVNTLAVIGVAAVLVHDHLL